MDLASLPYILAVMVSAAVEVGANIMLVKSKGFTHIKQACAALFLVGLAFTLLAYALQGMDLAVAYALWGGFGIIGTSVGGWILFGQRLRLTAWIGVAMLLSGMVILRLN